MKQKKAFSHADYKSSKNYDIIDARSLKIATIDKLPSKIASNVKQLNLSHNHITKLDNIQQFQWLFDLDISHNSISRCSEIMKLAELPKLMRLYLIGNPFLQDPLDEDVLEFLIQKQTDIQILSNQNLNRIQQLQEGELKVIFLQNYVKKMNCHEQIIEKHFPELLSQRRSVIKQDLINKLIMSKIMPQFIQIIDDPKLRNKIKKQTVGLKRQQQLSLQDAILKSRHMQQQKVDNLIKDILVMSKQHQRQRSRTSRSKIHKQPIVIKQQQQLYIPSKSKAKKQMKPKMKTVGTSVNHLEQQPNQSIQSINDPDYLSFRRKLQRSKYKQPPQSPFLQVGKESRNYGRQQSLHQYNRINTSPQIYQRQLANSKSNYQNPAYDYQINENSRKRMNLIENLQKIQAEAQALASACAQVQAQAEKSIPQYRTYQQNSNFYSFNKIASSTMPHNKVPVNYKEILKNPKFRSKIEGSVGIESQKQAINNVIRGNDNKLTKRSQSNSPKKQAPLYNQESKQILNLRNKLDFINQRLNTQNKVLRYESGFGNYQTPSTSKIHTQSFANKYIPQTQKSDQLSQMAFQSKYSSKIDTKKIQLKFFRDTNNFSQFNSSSYNPLYFNQIKEKQIDENFQSNSPNKNQANRYSASPSRIKLPFPPMSPSPQKPSHSYQFPYQFNALNSSTMTPMQIYQQYYNHLTKYNPAFTLLYSDIKSLSSQQKSVLINALAKDHKNKTIELFIQRNKVKNLKNYAIETGTNYEQERDDLLSKLAEYKQIYSLTKSYNQKATNQNNRLNSLLKIMNQDLANSKQQNRKIMNQKIQKENQLKYLELQIANRNTQLQNLDNCDQISQNIRIITSKRLKKQFYQKITKRAKQFYLISLWKSKRQKKRNEKLVNLCWYILKRHLSTQILFKLKNSQKQSNMLKQYFQKWKIFKTQQKQINKKANKIKTILRLKFLNIFAKSCKRKLAKKKQHKLHCFWSNHHLLKNYFYKLLRKTKITKQQTSKKMVSSFYHYNRCLKKRMFNKLNEAVVLNKMNIDKAKDKIKQCKRLIFYDNWKKFYRSKLIHLQQIKKIDAISRILNLKFQYKNKIRLIKTVKQQNQEIKNKLNKILANNKKIAFLIFIKNSTKKLKKARTKQDLDKKCQMIKYNLNWHRFRNRLNLHQKLVRKTREFFAFAIKKDNLKQANLQRKSTILELCLNQNKQKIFISKLHRYTYRKKIFNLQVNRRLQQEQTNILVSKMRNLQQMEIQAIKSQYTKKMQLFQQEQILKDLQFRNNLMNLQNDNKKLQDSLKVFRVELKNLREKQEIFIKQKMLIEEQVRMSQQSKNQLNILNQNLRNQLNSVNTKYERILQLYSQIMFQLQKKDKQVELLYEKQKQKEKEKERDKTVQKQKRVGVVKNGQFSYYRSKLL